MKDGLKNDDLTTNMKNLYIIINCFIILFISSYCQKEKTSDAFSFVNIEANVRNMKKIYISQFADSVWYVSLECKIDNPIGWTSLIDFSEKFILASDMRICLLYDNEGHFIRQIGKQGRGPGEYTGIASVFLISGKIYIRDYLGDDLIEYLLNGTFVKRHKSGFTADEKYRMRDAIMINDSMIFGNIENRTGNAEYKALIIDKQGDVKYYYKNFTLFKLESGIMDVKAPVRANLFKFGHKIFFKEFYDDTLYQTDDQYNLTPAYVFNIGKYREPYYMRGMRWNQKDLSQYIGLDNIFQTENFLVINCDFNKYFSAKRLSPEIIRTPSGQDYIQWFNNTGQEVLGIYNKKTRNLIFSEPTSTNNQLFTSGFYNDYDAGPRFLPDQMVNDSVMVMKIKFKHLKDHITSDDFKCNIPKYPEKKKKLEEMVTNLNAFDNPVLMFMKFKKQDI